MSGGWRRCLWEAVALSVALCMALSGHAAPAVAQEPTGDGGASEGEVTVHVVQRGETLFRIAQDYGTSVEAVQAANNILDPTLIEVGQRLIIPTGSSVPDSALTKVVVQPSDSLTSLSVRHGASADQMAALNRITNPEMLFAGQTISLAADPSGAQPVPTGHVYEVQPGETANRIAVGQGVSLAALLHANHLANPAQIFPGQRLIVPGDGPLVNALESPWTDITIHPLPVEQGRTMALTIETDAPGVVSGRFLSRDVNVESEGQTHVAIIGLHAFTRPGIYPLELTFSGEDGSTASLSRGIMVADGGYLIETIDVPPNLSGLLDETLVDGEYAQISALMSGFTPQRYWDGLFLLPTGGDVASAFGTRRTYQGGGLELTDRFHSGADFAMPVGTPIYAPASGVVVFAGPLEVRGNATIIDHGWGVYTGYWHQSGILVQTGETVQAGQQIGNVGSTGLVTGAHLHWELWVSGVQVDPVQWVREEMP